MDFESFREAVKARFEELVGEIKKVHGDELHEDVAAKVQALDTEITTAQPDEQATNVPNAPAVPSPEGNPLNQASDPATAAATHPYPSVSGGAAPVGTNFAAPAPSLDAAPEEPASDQPAA